MVAAGGAGAAETSQNGDDVAAAGSSQSRPHFVAGEVIVKFKEAQAGSIAALSEDTILQRDQASLARLQSKYGVQSQGPVFKRVHEQARQGMSPGRMSVASTDAGARRSRDMLRFYVLKTERAVQAVCAELNADPAVEIAQPNYIYHLCRTPNDPEFPDQYAHQLIQMEDAWGISTGSRDIVVAVLDTGVDVNHPDLKANMWVNADEIPGNKLDDDGNGYVDDIHGWNFGMDTNDVTPEPGLYSSIAKHGTLVAGVIAAVGNNGKGVSGVNWQCSIMALRVSLDFTTEEAAEGLDYAAANGARVLNMSFGGDVFGPEGDLVVKTAIYNAYEQGVLLVASAGNSDTSLRHYPAAYPNVMAVASTNGEDAKTGHSTFGAWVDIAAPGTDIVTTDLGGEYLATAGTSFSAPYVAAVGALVLAHRPNLTNVEVRAILENTCDPVYYGDMDPDLGYIGVGRVNAFAALEGADGQYPLGEIVSPRTSQVFPADGNAVELCVFVHGDSFQVDYRPYGAADWTDLAAGASPTDPNGLVPLSLPDPGAGTWELRLRVTRGDLLHTDRKIFNITAASDQAHWPKPQDAQDEDYYYIYYMGSPLCMDVNGDGRNEIIQGTIDLSSYLGGGMVNIWGADGNSLPNWPAPAGYYGWPSSVAVGDIDGDGDYEVVAGSEMDGEVYAFHVESGRPVDGNWPAAVGGWYGYIAAGPVLADLDGDGDSEILVALDLKSADTDGLIALQGDGSYLWARRYSAEGPISVADLDRDGDVEIALCGLGPGLSRVYTFILDSNGQQVARWRGGSPKGTAFADLDGDGKTEMVFCTETEVMAVRADGSTVWKTKTDDALDTAGGLCVGDIDGNGLSEVYVVTYVEGDGFLFTRVYAFDHKGKLLTAAGYPKMIMGDPTRCIPLIADIDGDGAKELMVGSAGEPLMAWEADGSITPGFPMVNLSVDYEATPVLNDLDLDGDLEIMVAGDDYRFHVVDLPAPYADELVDWGMSRHDPQNSGWTAPSPRLDSIMAPSEVRPGERLEVHLTASNPGNLPLRWSVGNLPKGAWYDPETLTLFWKPAADQAFETYTLSFLVTDGVRQFSRSVSVAVVPNAIYFADMDSDPNWTLDEGWAWGDPNGNGSWGKDPASGHTGASVVGYALEGDYADNLGETRYATTGPIDCTGRKNVRLSFWRWLGVEAPYDFACVQVSGDGATWTDLWTTGLSHVSDGSWQYVEYLVPAGIADGSSTVYFRWGMGPTDDWVTAPGWNLDDVQVTAEAAD
jgi:subtilisin family serine protease